jgi:RNA polymerase sigma factor (sigma-70 family)
MPETPPMPPPLESDLLDRARRGDAVVWEGIVTQFGPVIRGYARARGVRDPDDLTQDVFVAAASRFEGFRGDWEDFRSWLFAIAYRQVVNRYRRSKFATDPLPPSLPSGAVSVEDEVIERIRGESAVDALQVLNDLERDVVLLRVLGGLDTEEVAQAVGKRPGNVRVIQSRAMGKLRAELIRRGYGADGLEGVEAAG